MVRWCGTIIPVNDLIASLAPDLITYQGRRMGSTRWVGTEKGFAPYPCWNTITWKEGEVPERGAGAPSGNVLVPGGG